MSKSDEGIAGLDSIFGAIGAVIGAIIGAAIAGTVMAWLLWPRFLCWLFEKAGLRKWAELEAVALRWNLLKWLAKPIGWLSRAAALGAVLGIVLLYLDEPSFRNYSVSAAILVFVLCSTMDALILLVEKVASAPETLKKKAGQAAEGYVKRILDRDIRDLFSAKTLHGTLFVFNEGTDKEFSAETDHILVSTKNIYLIETKYKSGAIHAKADANTWTVRTPHGEFEMRNALNQAKNSARLLEQHIQLPKQITPIVAFFGNDVSISGNPGNVDVADNLQRMILAFERSATGDDLRVDDVIDALRKASSNDPFAFRRHIARIEEKKELREDDRIVATASLD